MVEVTQGDRDAAQFMLIDLCAPMVELVTEDAALHLAAYRIACVKAALEAAARRADSTQQWMDDDGAPDYGAGMSAKHIRAIDPASIEVKP